MELALRMMMDVDGRKPKAPPSCTQEPKLRRLIASLERDLRKHPKRAAGAAELIETGKALCIARCGGCELTREKAAPDGRKVCRRRVLKQLSKSEPPVQSGPFILTSPATATAAFLAARCLACGKCSDMPRITPRSLLGTLPADASPPLRPVPRS